ncbi:hypothetical protein CTI12_AA410740 [Artemisia annua]|uniref:Uncharacterized protein n=1 Tax=Artemisia annua TaxID=35608 RepID=A0A2U1KZK1_ARTAN|nr:hypothetical protein CTI12_AA410740 [Artemisia annua]
MEEHMKLLKESVEFLGKISVTTKDDDPDRNILTDVCKKVDDVHCELRHQISSSDTDASYLIFQDSKSKFIKELVATAEMARVSKYDPDQLLLLRAYHMIDRVRDDLDCTSDAHMSSSVWRKDLTLMINNSRSQVENQLNAICNNVSNLTIKGDCSQHLVRFKEACLRLPMLPSRVNFLTSSCINVPIIICFDPYS